MEGHLLCDQPEHKAVDWRQDGKQCMRKRWSGKSRRSMRRRRRCGGRNIKRSKRCIITNKGTQTIQDGVTRQRRKLKYQMNVK